MKPEDNKKKLKPTNFPVQSLTESIQLISTIVKSKGELGCTLKEIALITGSGEGSLPLPVSTAVQYGIYESTYGAGYKPTPLFHRIATPTFQVERKKAIFEALSNPPLYKRLLEDFNGKVLPDEKGLANYLIREFGFKQYAIAKIVNSFFENFGDYIDSNNKLRFINNENIANTQIVTFEEKKDNTMIQATEQQEIIPQIIAEKEVPFLQDVSKANGYTVHIFGEGINTKLALTDEDDFLILQATINKLKKKIKTSTGDESKKGAEVQMD